MAVCLVTGNMEPIGWGKMEALGIKHLFTEPCFGGFGSDFCSGNTEQTWRDRAELVRCAGPRSCSGSRCGAAAAGLRLERMHGSNSVPCL